MSCLKSLLLPLMFSLLKPMLVSLLQMWLSDSSVPFNRLLPSGVREYTFRGLSLSKSHWLLMHPFSSRELSKG